MTKETMMTFRKRMMWALVLFAAVMAAAAGCRSAERRAFTVVMLPDTQCYSAQFPNIFLAQTNWIRENAASENIAFVTQVGDIVNNGGAEGEWKNADAAMARLDGVVPFGVAMGNHDYNDFGKGISTSFAQYFGPKRFAGRGWYVAGTDDGQCSAQVFRGAGRKVLILHLPYEPNDKAVAWAEGVLAAHPGVPTIVSTHSYVQPPASGANPFAGGARMLKSKVVDKYPQVFLVLCGHISIDAPQYRTDTRRGRGTVISLIADFQGGQWGGNGYLVLLKFDPATNNIDVRTYSPHLKQDLPDGKGRFTIPCPVPLGARRAEASVK